MNIFGGIVRCDDIARGILAALERVDIASPIVLRLDGTNEAEARKIIAERASEQIVSEPTMLERGAPRRRAGRRSEPVRGGVAPVSIFVDENTRVVVQGLTGSQGRFHGLRNRDYGTKVVAGVTPGKGGQDVEGIPIFDSVAEAVVATGADASFIAVPPRAAPGGDPRRRRRPASASSSASPSTSRPRTRHS